MEYIFKLIPIILVFLTWYIVYINAIKIASRSETKSINDEVVKIINNLNELSILFWLSYNDEKEMKSSDLKLYEFKISSELNKLYKLNNILSDRGLGLLTQDLVDLHENLTLDCEKRIQGLHDNEIFCISKAQCVMESCAYSQVNLYLNFESVYNVSTPDNIYSDLLKKMLRCIRIKKRI